MMSRCSRPRLSSGRALAAVVWPRTPRLNVTTAIPATSAARIISTSRCGLPLLLGRPVRSPLGRRALDGARRGEHVGHAVIPLVTRVLEHTGTSRPRLQVERGGPGGGPCRRIDEGDLVLDGVLPGTCEALDQMEEWRRPARVRL